MDPHAVRVCVCTLYEVGSALCIYFGWWLFAYAPFVRSQLVLGACADGGIFIFSRPAPAIGEWSFNVLHIMLID